MPQAVACLLAPSLGLEEPLRERIADELGAAREAELLHDVRPVRLRRPDRDEELLGDLLVRVTERQQPKDLSLALGERILLGSALSSASAAMSFAPSAGCT